MNNNTFIRHLGLSITLLGLSIHSGVAATAATQIPTKLLDISTIPSKVIMGGKGTVMTLAVHNKKPVLKIITLKAHSQAQAAHATSDGKVRFATVISGVLYYADGDVVDKSTEVAYPTGSILVISSGTKHWVSTRAEPLVLMLSSHDPLDIVQQ